MGRAKTDARKDPAPRAGRSARPGPSHGGGCLTLSRQSLRATGAGGREALAGPSPATTGAGSRGANGVQYAEPETNKFLETSCQRPRLPGRISGGSGGGRRCTDSVHDATGSGLIPGRLGAGFSKLRPRPPLQPTQKFIQGEIHSGHGLHHARDILPSPTTAAPAAADAAAASAPVSLAMERGLLVVRPPGAAPPRCRALRRRVNERPHCQAHNQSHRRCRHRRRRRRAAAAATIAAGRRRHGRGGGGGGRGGGGGSGGGGGGGGCGGDIAALGVVGGEREGARAGPERLGRDVEDLPDSNNRLRNRLG